MARKQLGANPSGVTDAATKAYIDSGATTLSNKFISPRVVAPTVGTSYVVDVTATDMYKIIGQNAAITLLDVMGSAVDGQKLIIRIKDDGTLRAITWGSTFQSSGSATLLASTVAGKTHHVGFVYDSSVQKWICVAVDATGY